MFTPLALDLATTTGWALHQTGMERPFFDAVRLPGGPNDVGAACYFLRKFLESKHALYHFTDIVFEDQFIPSSVNSSTARRLMGLAAEVETFCHVRKVENGETIRCYSVELSRWRKHFLGRGGGFKKAPDKKTYLLGHDPKELAIQKCAQLGWHTDLPDAAEACGILDFYMHVLKKADDRYVIPWRDRELFGGRVNALV